MTALLEIRGLTVRYGGVCAVDDVSFDVEPNSCVGLIGPNGAGKTTLIDAVTGFTTASGSILFDGASIHSLSAHRRARRGMCRTFQSLELFEELSIRENLLVAAEGTRWWSPIVDTILPRAQPPAERAVDDALALLGMSDLATRRPGDLSLGQRKLLTVARALSMRPKLLLLDEPAAGLDSHETRNLGRSLKGLTDGGITVVLVDHDMELVLGICEQIHVLEFGKLIASGPPSAIRAHEAVIHAYLGARSGEAQQAGVAT